MPLDCRHLSFVDYSIIAALKTLRERFGLARLPKSAALTTGFQLIA